MKINFDDIKNARNTSDAYNFFLKNYEAIMEKAGGQKINWHIMCEKLKAAGIKGGNGEPIKASNARLIWYRVRKNRHKGISITSEKSSAPPPVESKENTRVKEAVKQIEAILDRREVQSNSSSYSEHDEIAYTGPRPAGLPG